MVRWPDKWNRAFFLILNMLLVFPWARFRPAPTCKRQLHVSGQCYSPNTGYGLPCNMGTDTLGIWVMNVPIVPLHLVHLA